MVPGGTSVPASGEVDTTVPRGWPESTDPDATVAFRSAAASLDLASATVEPFTFGTRVVSPKSRDGVRKFGAGSPDSARCIEVRQRGPGIVAP